jgi:amino-acid N-acetyltransferase
MENTPQVLEQLSLRPATVHDVEPILDLVNELAAAGEMLPRAPATTIERLRDFVVAEVDGQFAGCGALALVWTDMAEVRSIAVAKEHRGKGLGRKMALFLLEEAERLGVARVMAFTYVTGFFDRLGFRQVDHAALPHKVFQDCLNCPKFHRCDEVAVVKDLSHSAGAPPLGPLSLPTPGRHLPKPNSKV